ncbi:unnamed protein product [Sphagnum troendelagicum]|uniref:Late embryogenesis abundant protein n=1 Tax=Sphagnum troendelagicum TaxID=128251 RepID=A0ABP0UAS9_9BRYO
MEGRRQVVLLWFALACFLACAVLHVSSASPAAAGNADAGEGDSHASTWPRSWAKEKMVQKLSTLTDVSARYMYMYIVSLETREPWRFMRGRQEDEYLAAAAIETLKPETLTPLGTCRSSEDDGHPNVKETALETRDERDPSAEDVTKLAYEQYEVPKDTVSDRESPCYGSYDAAKDAVAATSAKTGERAKYTTEKVADVARGTSGTAKKVTYDATTAKAQELGATASQKAKETVNAAAETGKKAYKAAAQNSKAALDVIEETATKTELVLEQALTTIRAAAELGKKMMKRKVEETLSDAATKQTKNETEAAAEQAKKAYELAVEKTWEAAECCKNENKERGNRRVTAPYIEFLSQELQRSSLSLLF